ncbi:MAG: 3'(2'),5'-bisphosphate nucleotidase CysQ [Rhizobiales bacterium]|nr:3'(2'),5'-bisphosphate nucleotidase CysQ [Hyphomicrobiales bacterium]
MLRRAGDEAARLALTYFRHDPLVWEKDGGSPVSEADIAVDRRLGELLLGERPGYGWLSEETADSDLRLGRERAFVVDPIDGTRSFVAGTRDWTVSLAVVEAGRPVVALLVAPALGITFHAIAGEGAFVDDKRLATSTVSDLAEARFASSRRYAGAVTVAAGTRAHKPRFIGSLAYRIALVGSGEIDVAIAKPNARDWDLAAADLLVHEAGARLATLAGASLRYNGRETTHPTLIAANPALFDDVVELVRRVDSEPQ